VGEAEASLVSALQCYEKALQPWHEDIQQAREAVQDMQVKQLMALSGMMGNPFIDLLRQDEKDQPLQKEMLELGAKGRSFLREGKLLESLDCFARAVEGVGQAAVERIDSGARV
jgi:tetratricopeptide (TPR) repeat protein